MYPSTMRAMDDALPEPDAPDITPNPTMQVPSLKLNDGNFIPLLGYGLGTANSKARRRTLSFDEEVVRFASQAVIAGFTHFDGAARYLNEAELGHALKQSGLPRERFFITTKTDAESHMSIQEEFDKSLDRLGLDYVDFFLVHSPFFIESEQRLQMVWADMEKIKVSGRAKSIGVSNFMKHHLEAIIGAAKILPALNAIEFHPYLQHKELLDFQRKHNIAVAAYGGLVPLHRGLPGPVDGAWKRLAAKYSVSEAEIGLRWVLDQDVAVITTSTSPDRLKSLMDRLFTFKLTPAEIEEVASLGRQRHFRGYWLKHLGRSDMR